MSITEKWPGLFFDKGGAVFNVQHPDFGAKADGSDDAAAIQSAINAAAVNNDTVFFPPGTYSCGSQLTYKPGVILKGHSAIISAKSGFTANSLFSAVSAGVECHGLVFDGANLPTLGSVFDGTQLAKGCLFLIDPDPSKLTTDSGNKALITGAKFFNCTFRNQPSSALYTINLSDVIIQGCTFSSNQDEATSAMSITHAFGNDSTGREVQNWTISNNIIEVLIDSGGDGNNKGFHFSGGIDGVSISGNTFRRVLQGVSEGTFANHLFIFLKKAKNISIVGNTFKNAGNVIKIETSTFGIVFASNTMHKCKNACVLLQGSSGSVIEGNTFLECESTMMELRDDNATGTVCEGIQILNNSFIDCGKTSPSSAEVCIRIVANANSGDTAALDTTDIVIRGNNFKGVQGTDKLHSAIRLQSDSSDDVTNEGTVRRTLIQNNSFSGNYAAEVFNFAGNIADLRFEGNNFFDLDVSNIISDNQATKSFTFSGLIFRGNTIDPCTALAAILTLTDANVTYSGGMLIDNNIINHAMTASTVRLGSTNTALKVFSFSGNVYLVEVDINVQLDSNVDCEVIRVSDNIFRNSATNSYILSHTGTSSANTFKFLVVANNISDGRVIINIATPATCTGKVYIYNNYSSLRPSSGGISFSNASSSLMTGLIGSNYIDSVDDPHQGALPVGVFYQGQGMITFAANDATPNVHLGSSFRTANSSSTTITNFDNGVPGQQIDIMINDVNTTVDFTGSNLKGNSGKDWGPLTTGDRMHCTFNGTNWLCIVDGSASHGTAHQVYQTNSAGTAAEWSDDIEVQGNFNVALDTFLAQKLTVVEEFGCNGLSAKGKHTTGGNLSSYATGAFGLDSDAKMSLLHAKVAAIDAALKANGIAVT